MITNFCPICGECYPYHHSGVKHDFASELMEAYHEKRDLPENDSRVIEMREFGRKTEAKNKELIESDDIEYLLKKEWSMGNGQCPICHACKPGFHSLGGIMKDGEFKSYYDANPNLRGTEKHDNDCALSRRINELRI